MLELENKEEKPKEGTSHKQVDAEKLEVAEMQFELSAEIGKASVDNSEPVEIIEEWEKCSALKNRNRQLKNKVQTLQENLKIARTQL